MSKPAAPITQEQQAQLEQLAAINAQRRNHMAEVNKALKEMHPLVKALAESGVSDYRISQESGLPLNRIKIWKSK